MENTHLNRILWVGPGSSTGILRAGPWRSAHSTIIPMMKPEYRLVVDVQTVVNFSYPKIKSENHVEMHKPAFWNREAAEKFKYLHVWQLD